MRRRERGFSEYESERDWGASAGWARSGLHERFASEPWEAANRFSRFVFRNSHIVEGLQVQPELRAGAKEMTQPQGRIAGNAACAVQDLCHAVGRHENLSRQFRGTHLQRLQFLGQMLARMNCH